MKFQRGMALSGLLFWAIVISLAAVLAIRVMPTAIEYFKILKDCKSVVAQLGPGATVPEIRQSFSRFAQVDHLDFMPEQLDITKQGGQIIISFAYEKRIPLFANVSLLIDYQGTTAGQ